MDSCDDPTCSRVHDGSNQHVHSVNCNGDDPAKCDCAGKCACPCHRPPSGAARDAIHIALTEGDESCPGGAHSILCDVLTDMLVRDRKSRR